MAPSGLKAVVRESECGAGGSEPGRGQGLVGCGSRGAGPSWGALEGVLLGGVATLGRIRSQSEQRAPPPPACHTPGGGGGCLPHPQGLPPPTGAALCGGVIVLILVSFHRDDSRQGWCKDIFHPRRNFHLAPPSLSPPSDNLRKLVKLAL